MAATIVELWKSTTARFEAARAQQEYILAEFPPQGYAKSISELLERMRQT